MQPVTALSIAGSDSGGGAGIQADIRSFNAFGVHATTAITAITAQNTRGVSNVEVASLDVIEAQVRAVTSDFDVRAVKTGMLATREIVQLVASLADAGLLPHLIVDPVLLATSGDSLMRSSGIDAYKEDLFPFATLVTPNLHEAAVLCGIDVRDADSLESVTELARDLLAFGPTAVLVKGGHFVNEEHAGESIDVFVTGDDVVLLAGPRIVTNNDHGTGCSLSAAIAAGVALERSVLDATRDAKSFVLAALSGAATWHLGEGRGPIDHLGWNE